MTPHPTPEPPQGYELLTEPFLREHGAVEGMLKRIEYSTDRWEAWRPGWNLNEHSLKTYTFIAPLGTMAAALTPLPEAKCDCEQRHKHTAGNHSPTCSIHLRYRHVLPGELAKMDEQQRVGLIWANKGKQDWTPCHFPPIGEDNIVSGDAFVAYALPLQPEKGKGREFKCVGCGFTSDDGNPCHLCGCEKFPLDVPITPPAHTGDEELRVRVHELKCWPIYFNAIREGRKRFEWRKDDRNFSLLDTLRLREWSPETQEYTGRQLDAQVTYKLSGPDFDVPLGYCVLSIQPLHTIEEKEQRQ